VAILGTLSLPTLANAEFTKDQITTMATAFIEAKNARQQADTTVEDVDYFISLLADEFKDEHIKFGVIVTDKADLRQGMIAKMADEIEYSDITINQIMVGRNVAFVKYTEHARVKPNHLDRFVEYQSTNILSLEFNEDGKINHIRRHHGL